MTNAPADLLGLRSTVMGLTGLRDPASVGIVGDAAHASSGGYHEGKTDLINAGVWYTDYSVRLTRDRNGCTESASAMDIGYAWPLGGNAAWLRFNNLLVADLHANRAELAPIRAANYTPDGSTRLRTDRESGWSVVSSSDTVDVHTHIEWYRDTEGNRQACLDRVAALVQAAVNNTNPEDDLTPEEHDRLVNIDQTCNALIRMEDHAQLTVGNQANLLGQQLEQIQAELSALTDQVTQLTRTVADIPRYPVTPNQS